jgi:hypothetical protein
LEDAGFDDAEDAEDSDEEEEEEEEETADELVGSDVEVEESVASAVAARRGRRARSFIFSFGLDFWCMCINN